MTAAEVAKHVHGEVVGDRSIELTGFAAADHCKPGDLTFAENAAYFARAEESAASAILVGDGFTSAKKVLIRVPSARVAFATVMPLFFPPPKFAPGTHASAIVDGSAQIDASAHVGPYCVIGERARLGARTVLEAGIHVGADCQLGEDVHLFPGVTLYPRTQLGNRVSIHAGTVIGSDGFGYVLHEGSHRKVPQIGNVIIYDDVEIGANVTIDRGALGPTIIGKGAKIDNLVQIGHNVVVGEHCIIVSQVGIAGSTKLGDHATIAGQAGVAGHLKIGRNAIVAAQAGVMNDIPDGEKWFGSPARPDRQMKRIYIGMQQLPELLQRVAELEKRLEEATRDGSS
jgi:UDP-3-O-[3-hydroxymyristoyl] glucosamine N-acyltransferase